ncbi:MAG: hypothetical protein ACSHX9_08145 [Luteolibacter sp.]
MKIHILLLLASVTLASAEKTVTPMIESVGMFKNGLTVVRATFPIDGPGDYLWEKVPQVVHGSFWIESDGEVIVQSTTRMVEETEEAEQPVGILQKDLAGKIVSITYEDGDGNVVTTAGTVWDAPALTQTKTWNTDYSSLNPNNGSYYWYRNQQTNNIPTQPTTGNYLVLDDPEEDGRRYINTSRILSIHVTNTSNPLVRKTEKPVLVFEVGEVPAKGGTVTITYLSKGLAWMPSYRIDLSDPEKLRIRHSAVIRNEMADLENTELQLISGFPNIRFGSVDSPLWPGTSLSSFFQQVNQSGTSNNFVITSNRIEMPVFSQNYSQGGGSTPVPDLSEVGNATDDIHYEGLGTRSMKAGETLSLDVMEASADYERVVEWVVPDPRDERGRYNSGNNPANEAWDAISFSNPFNAPMTTAATTITEDGKFRGQSQTGWVSPSQQTSVKITRALSIHTRSSEMEEEGERKIIYIGGNDYRRTTVKGRLSLRNFRSEDAVVTIRCEFSGELLAADLDPEKSLRLEGTNSVNPRRQLDWKITLPAGEEKELTYRYEVLVDH